MSVADDSKNFNWIIGPFGRAAKYVTDEYMMARLIPRGLIVLESHSTYLRLAKEKLSTLEENPLASRLDQIIEESDGYASFVAEYREDEFNRVNQHALVGMWGALEAMVEDTIVLILMKDPGALENAKRLGVNVKAQVNQKMSHVQASSLFRKIESATQKKESFHAGRTMARMLRGFQLKIIVSDRVMNNLNLISCLRNCILHAGGEVDARCESRSSGYFVEGDKIVVTESSIDAYYKSITEFMHLAISAVVESKYVRAKE